MFKVSERIKTIIKGANEYEEDEVIAPEPERSDSNWIRAWRLGLVSASRDKDYTDTDLLELALKELEDIQNCIPSS
jgi:hypothetical protein